MDLFVLCPSKKRFYKVGEGNSSLFSMSAPTSINAAAGFIYVTSHKAAAGQSLRVRRTLEHQKYDFHCSINK